MTEERRTSTSRRLERGPCVPGTRSTCAKCQDEKVGLLGRSAPATSPQGPGPATKPPQAHKPSSVPQSPQANSWPCGWAWSGTAWGRGSPCPRGRGRQGRDRGPEPGSELPASTKQKTPPPPHPRATPPPPGGNGKWRELSRVGLVTVPRTRTDPRAAQPQTSRPGASCGERAWFGGPWLPRF